MRTVKDTINLLPTGDNAPVRIVSVWTVATAVCLVLWVVLFGLQHRQRMDEQKKLDALIERRAGIERQLATIRSDLGLSGADTSSESTALVRQLLTERVLWSEVFRQFSRIIPRGIWFDSLEGTAAGRAEIKIRGAAFTYLAISDFLLAMEQSGYFEKPQLLSAQKTAVQGHEVIGFDIVSGVRKSPGGGNGR